MNKKSASVLIIDKLLYVMLVAVFFVTAITAVTTAKFTSTIRSNVVSNVSNAIINFADDTDGIVVLTDWKPGDSRTVNFDIRNYNDQNAVNEIAITYTIKIRTSALLPLNFTLSKTTDGTTTQIPLTLTQEQDTTFSVYTGTQSTLKHSLQQLDSYTLNIVWPEENNDADALEAGGEYIEIIVDWRQYIA